MLVDQRAACIFYVCVVERKGGKNEARKKRGLESLGRRRKAQAEEFLKKQLKRNRDGPPPPSFRSDPKITPHFFTSGRLARPDADVLGDVPVAEAPEHPRLVREVDGVERRPFPQPLDGDADGRGAGRGVRGDVLRDLDCAYRGGAEGGGETEGGERRG